MGVKDLFLSNTSICISGYPYQFAMPVRDEIDSVSSEYETESDESEEENGQMLKPVFIPKGNRLTIQEQEDKMLEEDMKEMEQRKVLEERKAESRKLVAESIQKLEEQEMAVNENYDSDDGLPQTEDVVDELAYEEWKIREIMRLKRDHEEKQLALFEKAETLRRRNMTDEERLAEDKAAGLIKDNYDDNDKKSKWKFMQKYYHKGAFYMDADSLKDKEDVRTKNYAKEATLEDTVDKEKLPEVLQVKNFGKRGRTKYTHLLDQDTTFNMKSSKRTDSRKDDRIMDKFLNGRSGVKKI